MSDNQIQSLETTTRSIRRGLVATRIAVAASLAISFAAGFVALSAAKQVEAVVHAAPQASPVVQSEAVGGYSFATEQDFQAAVVASLNKMVKDRQASEMTSKLAKQKEAVDEVPGDRKIYGALDARFTLVEFSETECPFCTKHHPTLKNLVDNSSGNINWEWKHLPLSFHNPAALQQAIVGECVAEQGGNRMFWVYIDEVFRQTAGNGKGVPDLTGLVESLGVDMDGVRTCVGNSKAKKIVEADMEQANKLNISGTPATIIVDNQTGSSHIISGAQPEGAITAVIERMLKETLKTSDASGSNAS